MRTRIILIVAVLLAIAGVTLSLRHAFAAAHMPAATSAAGKVSPKDSSSAPTVLYFVKNPDPAPPFLIRDLFGSLISMPALKGKVVFLNFWATWCGPCREEIPELVALQAKYKDKLVVIGASEDELPPAQVAGFAKSRGINYPIIMASPELEAEYGGVAALPTSFVIDEQGRVVQKHVGVYPLDFYDLEVRVLLGQSVDAKIETFQDTGQIFLKHASRATELPGVNLAGLTPAQRKIALKHMNSENCTCGCGMTLAQCRITDPGCATSREMANKIVREVLHAGPKKTGAPAKAGATIRM